MQKKDTSLLEYSEVERGKEFEYPDSISGIPIFDGSFLSWGKPEDIIRNGKVATRKNVGLLVRIRCFFHRG